MPKRLKIIQCRRCNRSFRRLINQECNSFHTIPTTETDLYSPVIPINKQRKKCYKRRCMEQRQIVRLSCRRIKFSGFKSLSPGPQEDSEDQSEVKNTGRWWWFFLLKFHATPNSKLFSFLILFNLERPKLKERVILNFSGSTKLKIKLISEPRKQAPKSSELRKL